MKGYKNIFKKNSKKLLHQWQQNDWLQLSSNHLKDNNIFNINYLCILKQYSSFVSICFFVVPMLQNFVQIFSYNPL